MGTGFSYTEDPNDYVVDENQVSNDMYLLCPFIIFYLYEIAGTLSCKSGSPAILR